MHHEIFMVGFCSHYIGNICSSNNFTGRQSLFALYPAWCKRCKLWGQPTAYCTSSAWDVWRGRWANFYKLIGVPCTGWKLSARHSVNQIQTSPLATFGSSCTGYIMFVLINYIWYWLRHQINYSSLCNFS